MRDALTGLVRSLGWEAESDTTVGLVSQLSKMVEVEGDSISVKEPPVYVARVGKTGYESLSDALAAAKGGRVKILADITDGIVVPAGSAVNLYLNGHSVKTEGAAFINHGKLTLTGGTIESTKSYAIVSATGATTTVDRCVVKSVEGAVITGKAKGTRVVVTDCDMYASDNAVVAGNGSEGFGGNVVQVIGSKLHGGITSANYVACGVYCPTDDTFTVEGCDIDVTGGCGILARAGRVTVRHTSIKTTGTVTGKVGDSRIVVPCSALVFDEEANYPSLSDEDGILAGGCTFDTEADNVTVVGGGERIEVL